MRAWSSVQMAVGALRVNKVRTALTALGVIIGVGAVVTMMAIGAGAQARVAEQIRSLGSNLIIVLSGSITSGGLRLGAGSQLTITEDDARAIQREVASVQAAAPVMRGGVQVVFGNTNWSTALQGVTPEYFQAREWDVISGRLLTPEDVDAAGKVVLLGQTVTENLFGGSDPIGQTVRIKKVPFTVVGVLARKGQSTQGDDQDDTVIVPLSTAKKKVLGISQANARAVGAILIKVRETGRMKEAESQIRELLRQRHHLQANQDDDFAIAEPVGDPGEPGGRLPRPEPAPRRGRGGLPRRGRHRHHEHHAGLGHGAHPRDRPAASRRGAARRHSQSIPRGGRVRLAGGRADRDRGGHHRLLRHRDHLPVECPGLVRRRSCPRSCSRARSASSSGTTRPARPRSSSRSRRSGMSEPGGQGLSRCRRHSMLRRCPHAVPPTSPAPPETPAAPPRRRRSPHRTPPERERRLLAVIAVLVAGAGIGAYFYARHLTVSSPYQTARVVRDR